ncbi:hypothetical protein M409DRAFT_18270 [Zasmidium cellare ATCC 36951]|uniref:Uncharacterized protein n=1 Tax=Zasmidium cellare ATCC 36951 TaxID=1080233 RepID=A0A6A6D0S3_ZASCE|nr:uncharacterized protein M409DRAFT_18270 [Zasmidium cellare ATCC 36951]KAF2172040.1 hypothetical protein M409DRAFT_18270 [Zasmidium cellare ATCC 36951]
MIQASKREVRKGVALTDPKAILLSISIVAAAIPNGIVNSSGIVIIREMSFSTTKINELEIVSDAVQIVTILVGGNVT